MADAAPQPFFSIEKIYVKDLSLELPNAPQIFLEQQAPQVEVQLANAANPLPQSNLYEVALTVTVTAKSGDKTFFLAEAAQAGIFTIRDVPAQDLEPILNIACPNILFPYAREAVADLIMRGGFPPVHLAPVNFEAMYAQRQQQQAGNGGGRIEIAH
jgi:preprotein translocase subunit SecB